MKFKSHNQRKAVMAKLKRQGDMVYLVRGDEKLAKLKVKKYGDSALALSDWKALKRGHGYGKKLLMKVIKENPKVYSITTDGFTQMGAKNIAKALPKFKIVDWRYGTGGFGAIWRQDAIDYKIEEQERHPERVPFVSFDPKFHSRNKKKK